MGNPEIELVQIGIEDVQTLRQLSIDTFEHPFAPGNTRANMDAYMGQAFAEVQLQIELQNPNSLWFFAMVEGIPTGYLKLNFGSAQTELQDEQAMEIERIYVLPQFYTAGVGQRLLDHALQIALSKCLTYVWLGVWEHNPRAVRFYVKNGFVRFGEHPFTMGDEVQTDWLMRRDF